jgi:alpha-1,2-mannosyltransferase
MSQEPQCLELIENEDERRIRRNWRVIGAIAVAAAGVLALQALLHGHLSAIDEYDDSVYFGASIELLHGVMPYRDFAFIQPPLITVWMLPFAATSSIVGTASAMEMGRIFVDIVTVTNIVLVGALVRRHTTLQVIAATGLMAFSQGTVRSSQTILLEPFLVLACLVALLCLMDGETITTSSRRHWWCGVCFGVAGATKVWAIFPLLAVVIVLSRSGMLPRWRVIGGSIIGFFACTLPFVSAAPIAFFKEVVLTQAIRNVGGLPPPERLADLTGIPEFSNLTFRGDLVALILISLTVVAGFAALLVSVAREERLHGSALGRLAVWGTLCVGIGLLFAPTFYYHYSGFMTPFVALLVSSFFGRFERWNDRATTVRGPARRAISSRLIAPLALAVLGGAVITEVVYLPVAPHVDDAISDAIPSHGCVLYSNPSLALLDNRFTAEISGCPRVIDWMGQERVLDSGHSVVLSDTKDRRLQEVMSHWISSSDAVVLERGNVGLDSANKDYLRTHFDRDAHMPQGLRIYRREFESNSKSRRPSGVDRDAQEKLSH